MLPLEINFRAGDGADVFPFNDTAFDMVINCHVGFNINDIHRILQQLFNSADVAVVGRFAGDTALAAVGSCVALVGIFVNLIVGLSVGPNAALANLIGQRKREYINPMIHTILTFGLILGILLMGFGMVVARGILELSGTPKSVIQEALLYIRIYFLSLPWMLVYNFGAAVLRSFGDTKRPMYLFKVELTALEKLRLQDHHWL